MATQLTKLVKNVFYPDGGSDPESASSAPQTIYNPSTPVTQTIPGGLRDQQIINISGATRPNAKRFTVNIQKGPGDKGDIGFHMDVRIDCGGRDKNVIVRNSRFSGTWGTEERGAPLTFSPEKHFEMSILVELQHFKVTVNNAELLKYNHKFPISTLDTLSITGDVDVGKITI